VDDRHQFPVLDGLRGVAAVCVAVFHGSFIFGGKTLLPEAYLAVDFFFLLSGVVVAHAYERRLQAGQTFDYMVKRAIRLYPMILIGAALGALFYATNAQARGSASLWIVAQLYVLASLCLPVLKDNIFPPSHGITPLNVPSWSLFFELFVNAVYGLTARFLQTRWLAAVVLLSFFVESIGIHHYRDANFGFHITEFCWGFARVVFPFFTGVLINRIIPVNRRRNASLPPAILGGLLVLTFAVRAHGAFSAVLDLLDIALIYPAIIILAMRATPGRSELTALKWLGVLSYPIYIIHHPLFLWMARLLQAMNIRPDAHPYMWICLGVLGAGLCAAAIYRAYDMPIRAWLTRLQKQFISPVSNAGFPRDSR
jgi:peptidoglycan/LPS O-acetylase OafA/YrhL